MKFFVLIFAVWTCQLLAGADGTVRIADTLGDGVFRAAALQLALAGKTVACTQERVTPEKAFAGLQKGDYDLVLAYRSLVPESLQSQCRDYAVDAVMLSVNAGNSRSSFTSGELAEAFSGKRRSWVSFNGEDRQIHLMRLEDNSSAVEIFRKKVMGKLAFAPAFERKNTVELLHLAVLNKNALVLSVRPDAELSTGLKAVTVDGVYPSLENVKKGRYPLSERRAVLNGKHLSREAQILLETVFSADMGAVIADCGLIQP
ncbi:MAG: substrate-binding domain-containing protein [Lentisphaeria bacterium]|nr:substrate-binding domain-containing protein [Lentisphaeria bacterium]